MGDEFVGINPETSEKRIPHAWENTTFTHAELPDALVIEKEVFNKAEKVEDGGEVQRAKYHKNSMGTNDYIGYSDEELQREIPELIRRCLDEMAAIETAARQPAEERLKRLKQIAPAVTRIIVRSAPGDYYHFNKKDKYEDDPAMQGADRVRGDQAAILAIVLAGIKDNWPDDDLLFLLNQHFLMDDNERLNSLRRKAKEAVRNSGIRLVYSGREDEVNAVQRALRKPNMFIPEENVDILDPSTIHDTIDQTRQLAEYLKGAMHAGEAFIEPSNVQAVRSMRMEEANKMIPQGVEAYHYAMPTVGGEPSFAYRKGEIRGTVFCALTGQASFDPAPHEII